MQNFIIENIKMRELNHLVFQLFRIVQYFAQKFTILIKRKNILPIGSIEQIVMVVLSYDFIYYSHKAVFKSF